MLGRAFKAITAWSATHESELGDDARSSLAMANFDNLREASQSTGTLMGTAMNYWHLNDDKYTSTAAKNYNLVTAEASCKMNMIAKVKGKYDFSGCDGVKNYAQSNGMKMRGHTLIWAKSGDWIPNWLRWEQNEWVIEDFMKTYIQTVVRHM